MPRLKSSATFAPGSIDWASTRRVARRRSNSGVPGVGLASMPKIPAMITSSVMACIRGASANGFPTGQPSISRSAASAIICAYRATASPWNGGRRSLRWRRWRGPIAVRTEFGPTIGRSGDSPVSEGACSGLAVKSDLTWSGWLVTTTCSSRSMVRIRNGSPSSRWARKTNESCLVLKRTVWTGRGHGTAGGRRTGAPSSGAGPAGDGDGAVSANGEGGAGGDWGRSGAAVSDMGTSSGRVAAVPAGRPY